MIIHHLMHLKSVAYIKYLELASCHHIKCIQQFRACAVHLKVLCMTTSEHVHVWKSLSALAPRLMV